MAEIFKHYKKESRIDWGMTIDADKTIPTEKIQLGAILRIADSLEKMEQPFADLIDKAQRYERYYREQVEKNETLRKRVAAYQGIINRMKKERVK